MQLTSAQIQELAQKVCAVLDASKQSFTDLKGVSIHHDGLHIPSTDSKQPETITSINNKVITQLFGKIDAITQRVNQVARKRIQPQKESSEEQELDHKKAKSTGKQEEV